MNPKGVRLACPQCQLDVVMTSEQDCPAPVTRVVKGVPWCPNCSIPMVPIASVDTTPRPTTGITAAMTLEDIARKCAEIEREVGELAEDLRAAKELHTEAKKAHDAKVVTLRLAVARLGRVLGGEQIEADRPLLSLADESATIMEVGDVPDLPPDLDGGRCQAINRGPDDIVVQCGGVAGHGGLHGLGNLSWDDPPDDPPPAENEDAAGVESARVLPRRRRRTRREIEDAHAETLADA